MKTTLLSGFAAFAIAGYGVYDYARPVSAASDATQNVAEELAKQPPVDAKSPDELAKDDKLAKTPDELAKEPESQAKNPEASGTIFE